jgi:hypothetical protein
MVKAPRDAGLFSVFGRMPEAEKFRLGILLGSRSADGVHRSVNPPSRSFVPLGEARGTFSVLQTFSFVIVSQSSCFFKGPWILKNDSEKSIFF